MEFNDIKKLSRFKDIVGIFAKYGFDEVVDRLNLPGADFLHSIGTVDTSLGLFERIRIVIEELGPTFIKFGQIMSLRPDLLPEKLLHELEKLQDNVPAVDFVDIVKVIEECLGKPIVEVFSLFDGVKFKEILSEAKYDRQLIARQGLQTVVQQILGACPRMHFPPYLR